MDLLEIALIEIVAVVAVNIIAPRSRSRLRCGRIVEQALALTPSTAACGRQSCSAPSAQSW